VPKSDLLYDVGEYAPVADRITMFYARFPTGRILTRIISRTRYEITVQAFVFRSVDEPRPSATGLASERIGDGDVNTVACLENTETSAIGRALANLGLTASVHRPSREEIEKADRERARRAAEVAPPRLTTSIARPRENVTLQRLAGRAMDALDLLAQAERAGFATGRARRLRRVLAQPALTTASVERIERALRSWIASRHALRLRL
jgi:hypothetical protein